MSRTIRRRDYELQRRNSWLVSHYHKPYWVLEPYSGHGLHRVDVEMDEAEAKREYHKIHCDGTKLTPMYPDRRHRSVLKAIHTTLANREIRKFLLNPDHEVIIPRKPLG